MTQTAITIGIPTNNWFAELKRTVADLAEQIRVAGLTDGVREVGGKQEEADRPVRGVRDEIIHFVASRQDIADRERAEEAFEGQREVLHQSEELAAMGKPLAGVITSE